MIIVTAFAERKGIEQRSDIEDVGSLCFEGLDHVLESFLEMQAVDHDQVRSLHGRNLGGGRLVVVRVGTNGIEDLHGRSVPDDLGDDVAPDRRGHDD